MLFNWFGISLQRINKDLKKEINLLESALNYSDSSYPKQRVQLLTKLIHADERLNVEHLIKRDLEELEKNGKSILIAETLLMLQRDFHKDGLWRELKFIWKKELSSLKENNISQAKEYFNKQLKIVSLIKKINSLEFHETHMHFAPSVDPHLHWKALKRQWVSPKLKKSLLLRPELDSNQRNILSEIMSSSKSDVSKFIQFSKFIILDKRRSFRAFQEKGNILNAIQAVEMERIVEKNQDYRPKYLKDALINIVKHCLKHNIKYIEIRFPIEKDWQYEEFAKIAHSVEEKYGVYVRFVNFLIGVDINKSMNHFNSLKNPNTKKYFVGFDSLHIKDSSLPIANHAGEYVNQSDFNFFKGDENKNYSRAKNVLRTLEEIKHSLKMNKIKRLGHASVLALEIKDYVSKAKPNEPPSLKEDIRRAKNLQNKLLDNIARRKGKDRIYVEANPTSNVMIGGFTYKTHPITTFEEHKIRYTISTDDRVIFDTNMKKEFYRVARALDWGEKELEKAAKMQKEAIFAKL